MRLGGFGKLPMATQARTSTKPMEPRSHHISLKSDGQFLVTAGANNMARLWKIDGTAVVELKGITSRPTAERAEDDR